MEVERGRLATATLVTYSLPSAGLGFMEMLVGIYLLKYATDVLLVAPATVGLLFGLSRTWDAVADPVVGYLTDRTRSRLGRRRPWLLAGAIPLGLSFAMAWAPPASLEGGPLVLWLGAGILLFFTSVTVVDVPHAALGAELTDAYHERTRIFGVRRVLWGVGSLAAVAAIGAFDRLPDPRRTGAAVAVLAGALALASVAWTGLRMRERPEFQGRGAAQPLGAFRDVWRNPHARVLLVVFLLQQLGIVSLSVCLPFFSEYVLRTPEQTFLYLAVLFGASLVGVPLWMRLAPRFEKRTGLMAAMVLIAGAISLLVFAREGDTAFVFAIGVAGGLAVAGADVLFPSIQADVIDWDELHTGERKEGAYFAAWALARKSAAALASLGVGLALGALGFVPGAVQSPEVVQGLRALAALGPAVAYGLGTLLFLRFGLDRAAHRRILDALGRGLPPGAPARTAALAAAPAPGPRAGEWTPGP